MKNLYCDKLLMANFISNLFYSTAFPVVHLVLLKNLNNKIVSFNSIVLCISGIVFPILWNKYSEALYKRYSFFLLAEFLAYSIIAILVVTNVMSNKVYYLVDTFLFALISKNIVTGNNKLKALRYSTENQREQYDNNSNIMANSSSLIGFVISFLINIPVNIAFVLITIGICFDNIFYYQAYKETLRDYKGGIYMKKKKSDNRINFEELTPESVMKELMKIIPNEINDYAIACLGTKRSKYDIFGPLVGTMLTKMNVTNVYGTIEDNIHAVNIYNKVPKIIDKHSDDFILGVDAAIGDYVYSTSITTGSLSPGAGMNKELPAIGDANIKFVVSDNPFMLKLNNFNKIREKKIIKAAKAIAEGIKMHKEQLAFKTPQEA